MAQNEVHLNNVGTVFRFTIQDGGSAVDVSGASAQSILFEAPDGTIDTQTSSFTTDGTNGQVQYTAASGDLDQVGVWRLQATVTVSGNVYYSDKTEVIVHDNIAATQTAEPILLDEMKDWLRVTATDDDQLIYGIMQAARQLVEDLTRRKLVTATLTYKLQSFASEIRLPSPPLQSVTSITYVDTAGNSQTVAAATYDVDTATEPGRVLLAYNQNWPSDLRGHTNDITITYVAGYGNPITVPYGIKTAIKMLTANWHENRESTISGTIIGEVPMAVQALINQHKVIDYSIPEVA